jgi:hypothetical protein
VRLKTCRATARSAGRLAARGGGSSPAATRPARRPCRWRRRSAGGPTKQQRHRKQRHAGSRGYGAGVPPGSDLPPPPGRHQEAARHGPQGQGIGGRAARGLAGDPLHPATCPPICWQDGSATSARGRARSSRPASSNRTTQGGDRPGQRSTASRSPSLHRCWSATSPPAPRRCGGSAPSPCSVCCTASTPAPTRRQSPPRAAPSGRQPALTRRRAALRRHRQAPKR